MAEWNEAAKARNEFADLFESLDDSQQATTSLSSAWDARGVLCHLTSFTEATAFGFMKHLAKGKFNFDQVSQNMVNEMSDRSSEDVVAALRKNAAKGAPMPGFPEAMTTSDVVIHTQDVRRPLGLAESTSPELVQATLNFLTTAKQAKQMVDLKPMTNVRLEATDSDWAFGTGAVINGTSEALMMALANRPVLDELSGEGLANWT